MLIFTRTRFALCHKMFMFGVRMKFKAEGGKEDGKSSWLSARPRWS